MTHLHTGCRGTVRSTLAAVATLLWLAACSGGGGTDGTSTPDSGAPGPITGSGSPSTVDCSTGAIEGGGRYRLAGVVSEIGPDGHVSVGGVRFAADTAKVYVDGESASVASLRASDVASVTGTVDSNLQFGCATEISVDALIIAAIEAVDSTEQSSGILGTLTMLGQEIQIAPDTIFGDAVQPHQLSSLQPGDIVRVSGLYKDVGVIAATRIDRAAGNYAVAGVVTNLDAQNKIFRLNGSIPVDYAGAAFISSLTGEPRDGDPVRVTGTEFDAGGATEPGSVVLRPTFVWYNDHGTTFTVFPAGASLERGNLAQFTASSGPGSVTWSIVLSDGRACTPEACGEINPTTGVYNGSKFGNETSFLVIATSVADPTDRVAVPLYVSNNPRIPAVGGNTLEGDVFASATGPIPGAAISMWVEPVGRLPFTWFNLWADDAGHFVAQGLPDSLVHITAGKEGYVQPCVVRAYSGAGNVRVEMMPESAFDALDSPRPQLSVGPTLSGMVYETTPSGRQPVHGAIIAMHLFMWDNVIAATYSDRGGGYFLCNLGESLDITVFKRGYVHKQFVQFDTSQSRVLDIEIERQ